MKNSLQTMYECIMNARTALVLLDTSALSAEDQERVVQARSALRQVNALLIGMSAKEKQNGSDS